MSKELIILSDNFGTSYSGGCTATALFAEKWIDSFEKIHVVCKQTDGFLKDNVDIWEYNDQGSLDEILNNLGKRSTIGYGDYHTSIHFIPHSIPFYFTYHDNYPELKDLNVSASDAEMMMDNYGKIFFNAEYIFSVSASKLPYIQKYTDNCKIIRNGISQPITKKEVLPITQGEPIKILMAGNISSRKYKYAVELFDLIAKEGVSTFQFDIFGNVEDSEIYDRLNTFEFVNVASFQEVISYQGYHIYLSTSTIENLSLSVVDSLMNHTPVLTFDVGGLSEAVSSNNGILVEPYNINALYMALNKMKVDIPKYRFDSTVMSEFDWTKGANVMLSTMQKLGLK